MRNPSPAAPHAFQSAGQVSHGLAEVHKQAEIQAAEIAVAKAESQWLAYAAQRNAASPIDALYV